MSNSQLFHPSTLISARINPKLEEYYLVTNDNLWNIRTKNILNDLFVLLASLFWGAYFSVLITSAVSVNVPEATANALLVYQRVFLCGGVLFGVLAVVFAIAGYSAIQKVRKGGFKVPVHSNYGMQPSAGRAPDLEGP